VNLLLAMLLSQSFPTSITARQGRAFDGGMIAWSVECTNCSAGSVTVNGGGGTIDGGSVGISSLPLVFIGDAGVLNVNFPATQAVSIASMPSTPVTGSFWQAVQNVNIVDAGPPINVNFPASQAVTGTFWQSSQPISGTVTALQGAGSDGGLWQVGGTVNVNLLDAGGPLNLNPPATWPLPTGAATAARQDTGNTSLANLDVALSTRTKPADQQHTIIDSSASIAVTGPLTDTQLRASAVPVSAAALPLPTGASTDATLSQLLDGGTAQLAAIATALTNGTQQTQVTIIQRPLNPFLPRCNPVRRTGCQP
jgi:hypothetical protein